MSSAADSFSVPSPTKHPMKSRGAAGESELLHVDRRAAFMGGGPEAPEADLPPPATVAVTARSARSASSPAHPTTKLGGGGAHLHIDWSVIFRAERAEPPEADLSPSLPATVAQREVAVAERASKKICRSLCSISSALSERHVWADLTDSLLHLIIALFSSFHDFLAVTSTCRAWRATVSSFPSIYSIIFPPLYVKTGVRYAHRYMGGSHNSLSNYKWQFRDPAKTNLSLCCSAPRNSPYYVCYLGCSYGYFIFSCGEQCLLVDVYTSTMVKPPKFQHRDNSQIYYGILMAPLRSPNSSLLLFSGKSMFRWQVGAKSWTEHPLVAIRIRQIVWFKGQMFAMDSAQKLKTISLTPQLGMQEVPVVWGEDMVAGLLKNPWLVVCGDMLLMVDLWISVEKSNVSRKFCFQVFRLDLSAEPAKWVKMEKLEDWALFVSIDRRSPTFACMSPERWGGKSNCIYVPSISEDSGEPCISVEIGQSMSRRTHPVSYIRGSKKRDLENLWVLPSLFYGVGQ